jgi:Ca2+-binding RTX toxin-like protein
VINDNDFTVGNITIDSTTGTFTRNADPESIQLGLISLQSTGLDASDRDGGIKIRQQPVFGMYQPDAIASYTVNGQTYYITANEGDARDYDGFAEETRVKDLKLDPIAFPNASVLKADANLGRLTVTNATGDLDGDSDIDRLEVFGGRSFSIWDANGKLVFDSGDQFEQITAAQVPDIFNSNGAPDTFDTRSDNKGPEPEGMTVGTIEGRTYAFIGLERTGGVMIYDVTNPTQPTFIEYIPTPNDIAPEGLLFVSAADSPNGKPLLITTNEESDTTAIFEVDPYNIIDGTNRKDDLSGSNDRDRIRGFGGNDTINAKSGNDLVTGDAGEDDLRGGTGDDALLGGSENDTLAGDAGNDKILGQLGDDKLAGDQGDDLLNGGLGSDTYTGGSGSDIFVLAKGQRIDTITDLKLNQSDKIGLSDGLTFNELILSSSSSNSHDTQIRTTDGDNLAIVQGIRAIDLLTVSSTVFVSI